MYLADQFSDTGQNWESCQHLCYNRPQMPGSQPYGTCLSWLWAGLRSEERCIDPLERWVRYCFRDFYVPKDLLEQK